jgi:hypothetical protein
MMNDLLTFVVEGYNRYSIAALAGVVCQELPQLPVAFIEGKKDPAKVADQVRALARQQQRVILAWSFMSPQLPRIMPMLDRKGGLQRGHSRRSTGRRTPAQ